MPGPSRTQSSSSGRIDGEVRDLSENIKLEKTFKHNIEVIVDRLVIKEGIESRLTDSVETATKLAEGLVVVDVIGGEEMQFSQNYACPEHGISMDDLAPRMFSFNNPFGACPKCTGLGSYTIIDEDLLMPDKSLSIREGAIKAPGWMKTDGGTIAEMYYEGVSEHFGFSIDTPVKDMKREDLEKILYGTGDERVAFHRRTTYSDGKWQARSKALSTTF